MFTSTALAACLIHADVRARSSGEAQTITCEGWFEGDGVTFCLYTSHEVAVLRESNNLGDKRPLITILPSGAVETHRITTIPPEAQLHV